MAKGKGKTTTVRAVSRPRRASETTYLTDPTIQARKLANWLWKDVAAQSLEDGDRFLGEALPLVQARILSDLKSKSDKKKKYAVAAFLRLFAQINNRHNTHARYVENLMAAISNRQVSENQLESQKIAAGMSIGGATLQSLIEQG